MFQELAAFYDLFMPMVNAVGEQKLSFGSDGQLAGPAAAQTTEQRNRVLQQQTKTTQPAGVTQLFTSLQQRLDANKITWEPVPGRTMVRLTLFDELDNQNGYFAYVTDLGKVVLEARSRWTVAPDRRNAIVGSKYLLFLNWGWTTSGAYFLDFTDSRMVCRSGFSAAKLEQQLPTALFTRTTMFFTQMAKRLCDLRQVVEARVRSESEYQGVRLTEFRGSTHDEIGAAVSTVMQQSGDPLLTDYQRTLSAFGQDVGAALEDMHI